MIDEDRTYENEVRFNNDRLVINKDRKSIKVNIPLDMESTSTQKILQKEEVNEFYINNDNM